jgi:hypothetical protein
MTPPTSDAEVVMNAMHCGLDLIGDFTSASIGGWPVQSYGSVIAISQGQARKAAKCVEKALRRTEGRDAISVMAQGFGRATAENWGAAASTDKYREVADRLNTNAAASEKLADLVASTWPATGYEAVLAKVAHAEGHRMFEVDNPDAMVDLARYARVARATADALAVAMSARFDEFEDAILGPVRGFHIGHDMQMGVSWRSASKHWANLLAPSPLSWADVAQTLTAETFGPPTP